MLYVKVSYILFVNAATVLTSIVLGPLSLMNHEARSSPRDCIFHSGSPKIPCAIVFPAQMIHENVSNWIA